MPARGVALVTGATGLLGGWLVRALIDRGVDVVVLVRDGVPGAMVWDQRDRLRAVVHGSVEDQALLERALGEYEVETVFHLAAQTIVGVANRNPVATFETNVAGTWRLLEACRRSPGVRAVIVASSDKAYGDQPILPYEESAPLQGRHPYDVSKSCADLIAQCYAHTYGLPVAITRCGNLYGGGDLNWNRVIPGTIRSALAGEAPIVRSDGSCVRDYFYVEDAALAYLDLADALLADSGLAGEAFNFSTEQPMTVMEIVSASLLACGREDLRPVVLGEARNEIERQWLSAAKARERLGWRPRFSMGEGLRRTAAWYREALDASRFAA
jgi:CDP-glucose 4,6-dehydratase